MATVFWLLTEPVWTFPAHILSTPRNLGLAAYTVIGGTLIPFICMITALRHIAAPRAGVVATLEPVLGALLAWPILGQALSPIQIAGGLAVIAAVIWVRMQRSVGDAELAPGFGKAFGDGRHRAHFEPPATRHPPAARAPEPARRPKAYVE